MGTKGDSKPQGKGTTEVDLIQVRQELPAARLRARNSL